MAIPITGRITDPIIAGIAPGITTATTIADGIALTITAHITMTIIMATTGDIMITGITPRPQTGTAPITTAAFLPGPLMAIAAGFRGIIPPAKGKPITIQGIEQEDPPLPAVL